MSVGVGASFARRGHGDDHSIVRRVFPAGGALAVAQHVPAVRTPQAREQGTHTVLTGYSQGTHKVLAGCLQCAPRRHVSTDPSLLTVAVPEQMWGRGEPSVGADVGQAGERGGGGGGFF